MANSDVVITQAAKYGPKLLDPKQVLVLFALGLYQNENSSNVSTDAVTIKSRIQTAVTMMRGVPRSKLLAALTAIIWAGLDTAAAADLANTSTKTKLASVAASYLLTVDDDTLLRFCLYNIGKIESVLT